jgi:hypothetical protein
VFHTEIEKLKLTLALTLSFIRETKRDISNRKIKMDFQICISSALPNIHWGASLSHGNVDVEPVK